MLFFFLSCGKTGTYSLKFALNPLFSTLLGFIAFREMHSEGPLVKFLVRRIQSTVLTSLRLPENVCKAPAVSLISVRSSHSPASFQRACLSFLGDPERTHTRSVGPSLIKYQVNDNSNTTKKYILVRNTFHNKSHNNVSALARDSPSSTEHVVLESTGAQNTMQKVRKLALVGIVLNHMFFFSSDPAVSSPIFVGDK